MINELIEQIGGRERLEEICAFTHTNGIEHCNRQEWQLMARALLVVLDAQVVGEVRLGDYLEDGTRPAMVVCLHDLADGTKLYTTPQAASAPDGLAASVNRLLDSDGSRGKFSAIRRGDALAEVERLLAAAPALGGDGG